MSSGQVYTPQAQPQPQQQPVMPVQTMPVQAMPAEAVLMQPMPAQFAGGATRGGGQERPGSEMEEPSGQSAQRKEEQTLPSWLQSHRSESSSSLVTSQRGPAIPGDTLAEQERSFFE